MLRFTRPSFKSGIMIVKVTVSDTELGWPLTPAQKNTDVDFERDGFDTGAIETALVAKYPAFLATPPA